MFDKRSSYSGTFGPKILTRCKLLFKELIFIFIGLNRREIYIVNNHPLTKNKPIYHARISEQMKWRGSPEPFHLFTFRE